MNARPSNIDPGIVSSRRALIDVIIGLSDHIEALTVLGGHAVIEVTRRLPSLPPPDTTYDGDLGVTPQLLAETPLLVERMIQLGYAANRPDRPGVWTSTGKGRKTYEGVSVDLIAPLSVARGGTKRRIRAARVGAHGKHSVSATEGTELSLFDRSLMELRPFGDGPSVETYVAGPSALLCAKAYKLHDRLDPRELSRNRDRLRPKDFADLYRLLHAVEPETAAAAFRRGLGVEGVGQAVELGRDHLTNILSDETMVASFVSKSWGEVGEKDVVAQFVRSWREGFTG